jgi:hypothetical protein
MTECKFSLGPDAAHTAIIEVLARVRRRTADLVAPISDDGLTRQHSPSVSPIVWDLGNNAEFESPRLVQRLGDVVGVPAVLRGASRAADVATFRNWDSPIRRQIFAGFRIAGEESR